MMIAPNKPLVREECFGSRNKTKSQPNRKRSNDDRPKFVPNALTPQRRKNRHQKGDVRGGSQSGS